ncbi:hypothetical protein ACFQ07_18525 [Actinomadura adrarensis]|uniref:Regulatory protein RecX n=1 Tax=Actinomadura adrarensis TaxID=1819600 RepID=A0ABW3CIA9_9ACTN
MSDQEVPADVRARALELIEERRRVIALHLLRDETGLSGQPLLDYFNGLRYEVLSRGVTAEAEALALELLARGKTRKAAWDVRKRAGIGYGQAIDYVRLLKDMGGPPASAS